MPLSKYNKQFGGNAEKAHAAMIKEYGSEKGERVFYALKNKRKNTVNKMASKISRMRRKG